MNSQTNNKTKRSCLGCLGRTLLGGLALFVVLALVGAVWQSLSYKADQKQYPPLGRLVDVDGHAMHIYCTGEGSPTVLLEGGVPEWSIHWQKVQPELSKSTRVCSYDRAGYGWSEPGPMPRTTEQIVSELHTLLVNAGEHEPFLLVSHSFSGPTSLLYQHEYPNEVVGMVLIETWSPELFASMPDEIAQSLPMLQFFRATTPLGLVRLMDRAMPLADSLQTQHLPDSMQPIYRAAYSSGMWGTMYEEYSAIPQNGLQTRNLGTLGDLPLIVVRASERAADDYPSDEVWDATLQGLADLSTNSKLVVAQNSGHLVQLDQPQWTVDLVRGMLEEIK